MKLYCGNLPYSATEAALRELFERHGAVLDVAVVAGDIPGRNRGFAFVEMQEADAKNAIAALHGTDFLGRPLRVSEANRRVP